MTTTGGNKTCDILDVAKMIESSSGLSDNTKKRYLFSLRRIDSTDPTRKTCELLLDAHGTFTRLQKQVKTITTQQTILIGVLHVIRRIQKAHPGFYEKHQDELKKWYGVSALVSKRIRDQNGKNQMTPRQRLAHVPWEDIVSARNAVGKRSPGSKAHLLLCMYTMLPPRRQMDYFRVRLFQQQGHRIASDSGYLEYLSDGKRARLHISKFKTVKYMEPWEKSVPSNLLTVIRKSLEQHPRKFLFVSGNDEDPFDTVNAFTQFSNRVLKHYVGNHCTVNSLRHSYATHVAETGSKRVENVARDMAHSVDMHRRYVFSIPKESTSSKKKIKGEDRRRSSSKRRRR